VFEVVEGFEKVAPVYPVGEGLGGLVFGRLGIGDWIIGNWNLPDLPCFPYFPYFPDLHSSNLHQSALRFHEFRRLQTQHPSWLLILINSVVILKKSIFSRKV